MAPSQTQRVSSASHCSGVFGVPSRFISDRRDLDTVFTTGRHQTIARYELPIICLVGAGLAGDDNMLAMVFDSFATEAVRRMSTVRVVGILSI